MTLIVLLAGLLRPAAAVCQTQQRPRLSAFRAQLFYESTGTFSENVLTEKGFDLWNTPFDSTYSTFVVVEVEGVPSYLDRPVRVELTASYVPFDRTRGAITLRQFEAIRNGSESGKAYAGFWLTRTGCNPVHLTARIVGRRQRLREIIRFGCGE